MTRRQQILLALMVAVTAMVGAVPSSAGAATQIGQTFTPTGVLCGTTSSSTYIQSGSAPTPATQYTVPFAGVITTWSFQAPASGVPQPKFKVARPVGGNNFKIVGEEGPRTPNPGVLNTYPTRIGVQAGDVIGLNVVPPGGACGRGSAGYVVGVKSGDPPLETTAFFSPVTNAQLDLSASLEPDADGDGFGDETQDACPTGASTQDPCPAAADAAAPNATITASPKAKTKKKQATFEFTGTDARVVASFECSLNGAPFTSCTSPLTLKSKKGKNHFEVRAKDAAGNTDPTPATFDWKVKKKKRR